MVGQLKEYMTKEKTSSPTMEIEALMYHAQLMPRKTAML